MNVFVKGNLFVYWSSRKNSPLSLFKSQSHTFPGHRKKENFTNNSEKEQTSRNEHPLYLFGLLAAQYGHDLPSRSGLCAQFA